MWRDRIAWLLVLLAALLAYLFDNNAGTLAVLLCAALIPSVLAFLALMPGKPMVVLELPEVWKRGEAVQCALRLKGASPLAEIRGKFFCRNRLTQEEVSAPLRTAFSVTAMHCGTLEVGFEELYLYDPFGLLRRKAACEVPRTVQIFPQMFPMEAALAEDGAWSIEGDRYSTVKPGSDPSETFQIREYIPGDSIRQIHWKLSEKTDHTMVRELGLPVAGKVLLLLETTLLPGCRVDGAGIDAMLDVFVSLSHALTEDGVPHCAGWQKDGVYEEMEIEADTSGLPERLLALSVGPGESTVIGCRAGQALRPFAHTVIVSPYIPPDIDTLRGSGRVTVLLLDETEGAPLWDGGAAILPFSPGAFRETLARIEL